ncbi:hypothetical protein DFH28DRAFT_960545 [Melampsora americana]|nr:hypothetical protein DFH28DRAFT_960545 [Melampsora americana]
MSDLINLTQSVFLSSSSSVHSNSNSILPIEIHFEPFNFLKFISLLLVFLFIPFLSLAKLFTPTPTSNRQSSRNKRSFPVDYIRNSSDQPFLPLKTRRHFRMSHLGNQSKALNLGNSCSSSDSECESGDQPMQYRLVWGKRRRGEESEFVGQSAMKGGRERERRRRRELELERMKSEVTLTSSLPTKSRSVTISTIPIINPSTPFLSWPSPTSDLFALPLSTSSNSTSLFRSSSFNLSKSSHLSRHLNSASPPLVNSLVRQSKRFSGSTHH